MSQGQSSSFDLTDPLGIWRSFRDANLDAWAKGMANMTNTDAFAQVIGAQLDTLLATSAPFQKAIERYMEAYLAAAHMPSRSEVVSLAHRMTHVELRLDDLDTKLDTLFDTLSARVADSATARAADSAAAARTGAIDARLASLDERMTKLLDMMQQLASQPAAPDTSAPATSPGGNRSRRARPADAASETEPPPAGE